MYNICVLNISLIYEVCSVYGVFFSSIYRCKIENILLINSRLNTSYMFWHVTTDMI